MKTAANCPVGSILKFCGTVLTVTWFIAFVGVETSFAKKLLDETYDVPEQTQESNHSPSVGAKRLKKFKSYFKEESPEPEAEERIPFKEAEDGLEMRKIRRVGIGLQAAGNLGFGGALMELNFSPRWGFGVGIGGGYNYQAVMAQAKYVLAGEWLMPYMTFGFTRWFSINKTGYIEKTTPGFIADRLLNDDEKRSGEFSKNMIFPGIGLQLMQLKGEWAGASVYAEILALLDLGNFVSAPTATVGFLYYF